MSKDPKIIIPGATQTDEELDAELADRERPSEETLMIKDVSHLFKSSEFYADVFSEVVGFMHERFKMDPVDVGMVANLLGKFAFYGIEKEFTTDEMLDSIAVDIKERGDVIFETIKRIMYESGPPTKRSVQ